jgi:hypothetical protein
MNRNAVLKSKVLKANGINIATRLEHSHLRSAKHALPLGDAPENLEVPAAVARAFVKDMRAFFAEEDSTKRDEIAARQLYVLKQYNPPRAKKLRLSDINTMFLQMRDQV